MTPYKKRLNKYIRRMAEDMQLRNFADTTIDAYTFHADKLCWPVSGKTLAAGRIGRKPRLPIMAMNVSGQPPSQIPEFDRERWGFLRRPQPPECGPVHCMSRLILVSF